MTPFLERTLSFIPREWLAVLVPSVVFLIVVAAGLVARKIIASKLRSWSHSSGSTMHNVVLDVLRGPILLWIVMLGLFAVTETSDVSPDLARRLEGALKLLAILSVTIVAARLAGRIVRLYGMRRQGAATGTLTEVLATLIVGLLGVLTLLNALGISVTPILTALGVGGLAVALALQDTLSNFFSGFYVSLAGQIRVGDFIQIESGPRGYVTDIGWRSTTLRERTNNLIVIPNNKLAQSIVTNFHLPDRHTQLLIPVGVAYGSDADQVERILLEAVEQVAASNPALLNDPKPVALLLPGFSERALEFTIICRVADYEDQFAVQHQVRKAILERFKDAGIVIPAPIRLETNPLAQ
ncbi:MAG: mechanosensitive ion channel family protein [Acidobacteriota bacterium]